MEKRIIVPDTSVLIEGLVSDKIDELNPDKIMLHEAVVAELEHQANQNKAIGFLGLDEIMRLKHLSKEKGFEIEFAGRRPHASEIKYAKIGEIDSLIRELAYEHDAVLLTADKVQARIGEAKGMKIHLIQLEQLAKKIKLESFFDDTTMSVHLRENVPPAAKKGVPGNWEFIQLREEPLTMDEIKSISGEIIEEAGIRKNGFIELERPGSTIVQLGHFRVVITKPPFSDGWEITAVKPVRKLSIDEYQLSENLMKRISEQAEGVLIAGSPGAGKSTFAAALAEHYAEKGKIVKTIEAPRDLVLPDSITQYSMSHGDAQEIHDILLLTRPDYTLFDEMRNTADFRLFADMRLAGIGLAGVVHATNPIDAIQRFVGRIELGVIPQVIDTVIFIKDGKPFKVLSLQMIVKVPSGMTEADLARPVVVVNDFETKKPEYELYSYGEETVVVPIRHSKKAGHYALAEKQIESEMKRFTETVKAEIISENKAIVYVPEKDIARIIGKQGRNIEELENHLGISIDVKELGDAEEHSNSGEQLKYDVKISKKNIEFNLSPELSGKSVDLFIDSDFFMSAAVSKKGVIKIRKAHKLGKIIMDAINAGDGVNFRVKS